MSDWVTELAEMIKQRAKLRDMVQLSRTPTPLDVQMQRAAASNPPRPAPMSEGGGWAQFRDDATSGLKMIKGVLLGNPENAVDSTKSWWGSATIHDPITGEMSVTLPVPGERMMGTVDAGLAVLPFVGGAAKQGERFFSQLMRTLETKLPERATAEHVLNVARKGAKAEELRWSGLEDALASDPKKIWNKADVLKHVEANSPEIRERVIGAKMAPITWEPINWDRASDLPGETYTGNNGAFAIVKTDHGYDVFDRANYGQNRVISVSTLENAKRMANEYAERQFNFNFNRRNTPKFTQWALPGGENHRELVITMPQKKPRGVTIVPRQEGGFDFVSGGGIDLGYVDDANMTMQQAEALANQRYGTVYGGDPTYNVPTGHAYGDPELDVNRLLHARMNDRDGGKTLFLEELQSDWHQAGRKEGYATQTPKTLPRGMKFVRDEAPDTWNLISDNGNVLGSYEGNEQEAWRSMWDDIGETEGLDEKAIGVPDAPFKNTWHELGFRRMLQEAADGGYERLAWTTGAQQAKRYSLAQHVDRLRYNPNTGELLGFKGRNVGPIIQENVPADKLADYVGEELAKKLQAPAGKPLSFDDWWLEHDGGALPESTIKNGVTKNSPAAQAEYNMYLKDFPPQITDGNYPGFPFEIHQPATGLHKRFESREAAEEYVKKFEDYREARGADLELGGEGMKGFYDKMLPAYADKIGKKYGVKVEKHKIGKELKGNKLADYIAKEVKQDWPKGSTMWDIFDKVNYNIRLGRSPENYLQIQGLTPVDRADAKRYLDGILSKVKSEEVWSLPITDEMRRDLRSKGQPLYVAPVPHVPAPATKREESGGRPHVQIKDFMRGGMLR